MLALRGLGSVLGSAVTLNCPSPVPLAPGWKLDPVSVSHLAWDAAAQVHQSPALTEIVVDPPEFGKLNEVGLIVTVQGTPPSVTANDWVPMVTEPVRPLTAVLGAAE